MLVNYQNVKRYALAASFGIPGVAATFFGLFRIVEILNALSTASEKISVSSSDFSFFFMGVGFVLLAWAICFPPQPRKTWVERIVVVAASFLFVAIFLNIIFHLTLIFTQDFRGYKACDVYNGTGSIRKTFCKVSSN